MLHNLSQQYFTYFQNYLLKIMKLVATVIEQLQEI